MAATGISSAQTYSNTPNDTIQKIGILEDLQTLSIQQVNTTSDTIILKWEKVSESIPTDWEASVCDNFNCNTSLVDSGTMSPIIPGEYGLILLHITSHINYGTAVIRYAVWDITNPVLRDTLTYILTVVNPSSVDEMESKTAFNIFPNPANENIYIQSNRQLDFAFLITDILGNEITKGISNTANIDIPTRDLPNGFYHLTIFLEDKYISTKKFIIQH